MGDEIIVTGQVRRMQETNPAKVLVRDKNSRMRWHELWANNPRILQPGEQPETPQVLTNGPGLRPYIKEVTERKWTWLEWDCPVGEIYFASIEKQRAKTLDHPGVILEPNIKVRASPNKDWGMDRWIALAWLLNKEGIRFSQLGTSDHVLPGARWIKTVSFRHACAVLQRASAAVLPEGGLHHAAAALGVRSVVIYGGFISPKQTGYSMHTNLYAGGEPCGMRVPCDHCARAMKNIEPEFVLWELKKVLAK